MAKIPKTIREFAVREIDGLEFLEVCAVEELQDIGSVCIVPHDEEDEVALFYQQGTIYAMSNICKHNQRSVLHEGAVCDFVVECPLHNWKYDMRTGASIHNRGSLKTYTTAIIDGIVFVEKPQYEAPNWTF